MASEKQVQFDAARAIEQPLPRSQTRRRNLMVALGATAILATGLITGLGLSMFCGGAQGSSRDLSSLMNSIKSNAPALDLYARGLSLPTTHATSTKTSTTTTSGTTSSTVTCTRPNKFFGPTISPQLANSQKHSHNFSSIEKRDFIETIDHVETRDTIEKRAVVSTSLWQPSSGISWTYQLSMVPTSAQLQQASQYQVWDIDLFDTPSSSMVTIQAAGSKVICYFSAGTYENWRSDASQFQAADKGNDMADWAGETWINTNSANVRKIMAARLDNAVKKGCNGVDPDNMDAYNHNSGFNLTQADAINYMTYLSQQASLRGLAIGLKNAGDIIPSVISQVQYSVEEACHEYDECAIYKPFTDAGKPVFHVEYPKGSGVVNTQTVPSSTMTAICTCKADYNFSPIVKNNNLDSWQQGC